MALLNPIPYQNNYEFFVCWLDLSDNFYSGSSFEALWQLIWEDLLLFRALLDNTKIIFNVSRKLLRLKQSFIKTYLIALPDECNTNQISDKALDKTSIKFDKTEQHLNVFYYWWLRPIFHYFNLFIFYLDSLS